MNNKKEKLEIFISQNEDRPKQGSQEWLDMRTYTIGGSEISIIMNKNPYSKIKNLIAQKLGISEFKENIMMRWGKLFEEISSMIAKKIFKIDTMYKLGSLDGVCHHQKYSPDDLALIDFDNLSHVDMTDKLIVLFEYKCPYYTIPSKIIPTHYLPQIKTGLCSIKPSDIGIFMNNLYRICSIKNLQYTNEYNYNFHKKDNIDFIPETPIAVGIIYIHQTNEQKKNFIEKYDCVKKDENCLNISFDSNYDSNISENDDSISDMDNMSISNSDNDEIECDSILCPRYIDLEQILYYKNSNNLYDFGDSNYFILNELLDLVSKDMISIKYKKPIIFSDELYRTGLFNHTKSENKNNTERCIKRIELYKKKLFKHTYENPIGIISWKLMISDIITVKKDEHYLDPYIDKINKVIDIIHHIKSDDEDTTYKNFIKYYS